MSKGKKVSDLRTRERLEQQAVGVAKDKSGAIVKPVSPADKNK